jgi:hypothetical protein
MMDVRTRAGRLALTLILVVAAFAVGSLTRDKDGRYYQEDANRQSRSLPSSRMALAAPDIMSVARSSPVPPTEPHSSREHLETALLPLLKDIVPIPIETGLGPGNGGAIVVVDGRIIVVDQHGKFATVSDQGNRIEKLALPELPNNATDYESLAAKPREAFASMYRTKSSCPRSGPQR